MKRVSLFLFIFLMSPLALTAAENDRPRRNRRKPTIYSDCIMPGTPQRKRKKAVTKKPLSPTESKQTTSQKKGQRLPISKKRKAAPKKSRRPRKKQTTRQPKPIPAGISLFQLGNFFEREVYSDAEKQAEALAERFIEKFDGINRIAQQNKIARKVYAQNLFGIVQTRNDVTLTQQKPINW